MNYKEKAMELVSKFLPHARWCKGTFEIDEPKQCALICVDEIKLEIKEFINDDGYAQYRLDCLEEVKKEINKL